MHISWILVGLDLKVCGMMYKVHNLTLKIICILNKLYQYSTQLGGNALEVVNIPNQMTAIKMFVEEFTTVDEENVTIHSNDNTLNFNLVVLSSRVILGYLYYYSLVVKYTKVYYI